MNLLVKIYMKRHDRHDKTLFTTDFFNCCVLSCILFIHKSSFLFHTEKVVTDPNLTCLLLRKNQKKKQNKTKQNKTKKNIKKKNAFKSGLPICPKLWDIQFFSFSLIFTYFIPSLLLTSAVTASISPPSTLPLAEPSVPSLSKCVFSDASRPPPQ